uniref:VP2 n=1 Tax=Bat calicivirus TaxID=1514705 RepID=A0A0D3MCS2_9CALI|nr:VP2 [Bat calicivirus]
MGSWTTGVLGTVGLMGDLALGAGSLALGAENNKVNQDLAKLQLQALQMNLQLQKESLQLSRDWNNPAARVKAAMDAGFDPVSARQVAGAGFVHFQGGVSMQPIKSHDAINLRSSQLASQGLEAGRAFTHGVGRATRPTDFYNAAFMHQGGQDAFQGGDWRPPSSSWRGSQAGSVSTSSTSLGSWSSASTQLVKPARNWGSTSTPSTSPSLPSWATLSTPPNSIRVVPGTAAPRRPPLPKTWAQVAGGSLSSFKA